MGACVSTHNQNPSPIKLFGSNLLNPLSPTQQKPPIINAKPHTASFGSKEETFFDSQAWLDSDCDDDFMSVNGEFTPSRGSTPVHHNFSAGNNNNNKQHPPVSFPYPNTPEKKPRLSDLFKESLRADNYDFEDEDEDGEKKSKFSNGVKTKRERLGCFRSLVPSRSSSTNGRKMMMSPSPSPKPVVG